jgi:glucosyl-3-phosphoglycerate phosphatase
VSAERKRLLLLRHGQTAWNASKRAQGHADVPLDEVGRGQAARAARLVARLRPAALVSSDLARARETAERVAGACGLPVRYDERLREYAVGHNRHGLTLEEYAERHPHEYRLLRDGRTGEIPGRETPEALLDRWRPALAEVAAAIGPGETHVVVAHGAAIRTALADFLGWPLAARDDLADLANCGLVDLVSRAGSDRWRLAAYNVTG